MFKSAVNVVTPDSDTSVSRYLFGGNLEAMARVIYGGVWDRERNVARADAKAAVGAAGTTLLRWPGSSSASDYHWRDGIGPVEERPYYPTTWWTGFARQLAAAMMPAAQVEQTARAIGYPETNQFGTDEFLQYCLDLGAEPLLSVNIGGGDPPGSGTPEEAAAWVSYCNVDGQAPRRVDWWQLGNEVMGAYECGHAPPAEYGARVVELAGAMRAADPTIRLVAAACALTDDDFSAEFGEGVMGDLLAGWNQGVFSAAGEAVDAASVNWYFPGILPRTMRDDAADSLQIATGGDDLARKLDKVLAELDEVGGAAASLPISVCEWGLQTKFPDCYLADNHRRVDGLFFASCMNAMLRRADRVRIANLSMLANTVSPIQTNGDRHFVTAGYLVMRLYRWSVRRTLANVEVSTERLDIPPLKDVEGAGFLSTTAKQDRSASALDAVATTDPTGTTVYLTNRSVDQEVEVDVSGIAPRDARAAFRFVTSESPWDINTVDAPNVLHIEESSLEVRGGRARVVVPALTSGALVVGPIASGLADV